MTGGGAQHRGDAPSAWPASLGPSTSDAAALARTLLARCTFPAPGTAVVCGVSGGADSSALLVLAVFAGCDATAVHVDHGLRDGSAAEAAVVERLADLVGARFVARTAVVPPGANLEARARAARHGALGPDALLGHTADDQAETVLLALVRGAGLAGLAGIAAGRHPILGLRRAETMALVTALGLCTVNDPTNHSAAHRRNRVRHELLPLLDAIAERDVAAVIARQAALLRDDAGLLEALSAGVDPTDARALALAPAPLARRAVRRWLAPTLGGYPPDAAAVERVLAVARGEVLACEVAGPGPGPVRIARSHRKLRVTGGERGEELKKVDETGQRPRKWPSPPN